MSFRSEFLANFQKRLTESRQTSVRKDGRDRASPLAAL